MAKLSLKSKNEALNILKIYNKNNPWIISLKKDIIINNKINIFNDFIAEYILYNHDKEPKTINKTVKISDWYGESLKNDYNLDFIPKLISIKILLGETPSTYHCYIKYRQSMNPILIFLPKKGVLTNFLVEDYKNYSIDFDRYDRLSSIKNSERKIKPHQKDGIKFLLSRKKCILADDMGLGKMEPISSIIPTPDGFKKMGDLKKGDYVFDMHGESVKILNTHPHKNKDIYEVIFNDGSKVKCGLEHLWYVQNINWKKKEWRTLSLEEILRIGIHNKISESHIKQGIKKRNKWFIPTVKPIQYSEKNYFMHPYVLGIYIGDGNIYNDAVGISIPDYEYESANRISSLLNEGFKLSKNSKINCSQYTIIKTSENNSKINTFIQEIKRLELNIYGNNKFIPYEYKLGSIEQRIELLKGLMDANGSISKKNNKIEYSTNSHQLAEDVAELVFSLGGIAKIHSSNMVKNNKNIEKYQVIIKIGFCPFNIERKAERYNPTLNKKLIRYIEDIKYFGKEDAQCIYVESPEHTYVTGNRYVVTHNTLELSVASIEGNFDSILIICPASLKTGWKEELLWYVSERDISIIDSPNSMTKSELEKYLGYKEGHSNLTLKELREEAKDKGKWEDNRFVIINFDILDEFYQFPISRSKENIQKALDNSPLLKYILNKKSLIIIDEAHRLSNSDSSRYKIINDLIRKGKPDSVYLATGTPITNNPSNFYNVLKLINDPITNDWNYYMERYCDAIKVPAKGEKEKYTNLFLKKINKKSYYELNDEEKNNLKIYIRNNARMLTIPKGESNLEELKERVSHIYLRREKMDFNDLPQKYIHEIYYELNPTQKEEYNKLWEEYEALQLSENPEKELNKELLEGGLYRRYISKEMVPNTIKMANKLISENAKVIIACCYDDELYKLQEYYGNACVIYNGKMDLKQKDESKRKFIEDDNIKVFICNLIAAGVGLTLTVCNNLIFNTFDYVPGNNFQMQDRIHRIGQTKDCHIYYQIYKDTQYEKMWNIVIRKQTIIDEIIKNEKDK